MTNNNSKLLSLEARPTLATAPLGRFRVWHLTQICESLECSAEPGGDHIGCESAEGILLSPQLVILWARLEYQGLPVVKVGVVFRPFLVLLLIPKGTVFFKDSLRWNLANGEIVDAQSVDLICIMILAPAAPTGAVGTLVLDLMASCSRRRGNLGRARGRDLSAILREDHLHVA
eukprot:CAMPEP_0115163582 /NCGR_PEP_ID=MMETSP0227-20121206/72589_1 /TAXON_ID=89957 /ORGANISM="Polarella glacialis, Strain CCMP 1383" /LENGTH=173 /DNA_ID=CAMNT_0002575903 /DNA_START=41 /DNA_END=562 /DNA_ORIENTATION=-